MTGLSSETGRETKFHAVPYPVLSPDSRVNFWWKYERGPISPRAVCQTIAPVRALALLAVKRRSGLVAAAIRWLAVVGRVDPAQLNRFGRSAIAQRVR
jgi:hypothetical protein